MNRILNIIQTENLKMYVREAKGRVYNSLLAKDYLGQGIAHTYDNPIFCSTFENNNLPEVSFYKSYPTLVNKVFAKIAMDAFKEAVPLKKNNKAKEKNPFDGVFADEKLVENNNEVLDIFDLNEEEKVKPVENDDEVEGFKIDVLNKVKEIEKKLIENEIVA